MRKSSTSYWFSMISLLVADLSRVSKISDHARVTAPPEVLAPADFSSKIHKPLQQDVFDIDYVLDF